MELIWNWRIKAVNKAPEKVGKELIDPMKKASFSKKQMI